MTESVAPAAFERVRARALSFTFAATVLMLIGIGVLGVYVYRLGPLVGPGGEQSFGLAVSMMFLMGAMLTHLVDRTYRSWPMGRRFRPSAPGPVTDAGLVVALEVLVLVVAGGSIAYLMAALLS